MEEVDRITIENLALLGCDFSTDNTDEDPSSLADLTAPMIVEAAARCLEAINQSEEGSYPRVLPSAMSARFKVGQTLATAIAELGFKGEVGYQTFLYPNARDTRNILMFLVEKLPRDNIQSTEEVLTSGALLNRVIADSVKQALQAPWLPPYCKIDGLRKQGVKGAFTVESSAGMHSFNSRALFIPCLREDDSKSPLNAAFFERMPGVHEQAGGPRELACSLLERSVRLLEREQHPPPKAAKKQSSISGENSPLSQLVAKSIADNVEMAGKILAKSGARPILPPKPGRKQQQSENVSAANPTESREERRARMEGELEELRGRLAREQAEHSRLVGEIEEATATAGECQRELSRLEERAQPRQKQLELKTKTQALLPEAPDNIARLEEQVEKKRQQLVALAGKWEEHRVPMWEELRSLREAARSRTSVTERLQADMREDSASLEECNREMRAKEQRLREAQKRLGAIQGSGKKGGTRGEYTKRILDITENNRKQKVEIGRVIGEIMALQREINMLRGKLDRTYTVTDELVFRDAKSDEAVRKMYKMLAGLHDNCQQLVGVMEEKGRLTREIRELEEQSELETRKKNNENLAKIEADFREMKLSNKKLKAFLQENAG